MAVHSLVGFLGSERRKDESKDRVLRRIMDSNLRRMGQGFRQAFKWTEFDRNEEYKWANKTRAICKRIVSTNTRLLSMGFNKLVAEYKARRNHLQDKFRFIIQCLRSADAKYTLQAYNGLIARANMLIGVGIDRAELNKNKLIKRLMNQTFNLQCEAWNQLISFYRWAGIQALAARKEKHRILSRVMDASTRKLGQGLLQLQKFAQNEIDRENNLILRERGILRRILDANVRLMGMGLTQLINYNKYCRENLKNKLRFIIKCCNNADTQTMNQIYNKFKHQSAIHLSIANTHSHFNKIRCLDQLFNHKRKLISQGYLILLHHTRISRLQDLKALSSTTQLQTLKSQTLKRILSSAHRVKMIAFKQLLSHNRRLLSHSLLILQKKRGILNRITSSSTLLKSKAYNKLTLSYNLLKLNLKKRFKFLLSTLANKHLLYTLHAYNSMKQYKLALEGVGYLNYNASMKRKHFIRAIMGGGERHRGMAFNKLVAWAREGRGVERHREG
jgi:chemotaxis regulatin CheY-phosphate phosphatase CheZ